MCSTTWPASSPEATSSAAAIDKKSFVIPGARGHLRASLATSSAGPAPSRHRARRSRTGKNPTECPGSVHENRLETGLRETGASRMSGLSPCKRAPAAVKLGRINIDGFDNGECAPKSEFFLESGIGRGLEFAITYSASRRRSRNRIVANSSAPCPTLRVLTAALILIRADGNQSDLFHLRCGRIVNPSGPRAARLARSRGNRDVSNIANRRGGWTTWPGSVR
jgi:hypothetical protein